MDNATFNQELLRRLKTGESLVLTTSIPNEIVQKYPSEVVFLQYQINITTEQFNERINKLKGMEKKEDITPVLLKIKKEKEKYE